MASSTARARSRVAADQGGEPLARKPRSTRVLGVRFDALTMDGLIERIDHLIASGRGTIALANPEFVVEAQQNAGLREYLDACHFNVADGAGILWAARRLEGLELPERVTGTDFVPRLCELAAARGYRLFFLGGAPGVAEEAAARLGRRFPGLRIVGTRHGFFEDDAALVAEVNASDADVLMVCLGNPRQEQWIARNFSSLRAALVFGNGGALDFHAGRVRRAPAAVQRLRLEWLWRLLQDPTWKRFRRQLRLVHFVWLVERDRRRRAR